MKGSYWKADQNVMSRRRRKIEENRDLFIRADVKKQKGWTFGEAEASYITISLSLLRKNLSRYENHVHQFLTHLKSIDGSFEISDCSWSYTTWWLKFKFVQLNAPTNSIITSSSQILSWTHICLVEHGIIDLIDQNLPNAIPTSANDLTLPENTPQSYPLFARSFYTRTTSANTDHYSHSILMSKNH